MNFVAVGVQADGVGRTGHKAGDLVRYDLLDASE
jgi:hypothetical protein